MKRLMVVLVGMMFLLGMALVPVSFAQAPSGDVGKAITPQQFECPPGQFDMSYGKCKQPAQKAAADTKAITPQQSECPPGQFDMSYGRCKQPQPPKE